MTGIVGPRGVGKTSLLLQLLKEKLHDQENVLYVQLDDVHFSTQSLFEFAREFVLKGGKMLALDNLHKYPEGVTDLQKIAEELPDLKILFAGSSAGDDDGAFYELSRIASLHYLPGLSFREFLEFRYDHAFPVIQMDELLEYNRMPGVEVLHRIRPLQYFDEYLTQGFYPQQIENPALYYQSVMNLVNKVLTEDFSVVHRIDYESVLKIRRLLAKLAVEGPFKPNIEKLADEVGTTRDSLLKFLKYLHRAGMIGWLTKGHEDVNYFNKPDRLLMSNSCLIAALSPDLPSRESLLETFLHNQLRLAHQVNLTSRGSYLMDLEYEFEMEWMTGGSNKGKSKSQAYVVSPEAESASGNVIPLWMFGFLY
ncbi:MAG: AAA family ATPase [candidate division Zixibacteria bacterium]|nr:AAA family ATPase [candidate division Zixibacteria bacterium]